MSHVIRAFCTINNMLDGILDNTAPLGELSPTARTYSTTKTKIAKPQYENVSVTVFSCREDGVLKDLPADTDNHILSVMETVVQNFIDTLSFGDQFASRLPNTTLTESTAPINYQGRILPGYISWTATVSGEPITVKMWLSDAVFRASVADGGFDEFEIRVVPPIANPNNFDVNMSTMLQLVEDFTLGPRITAMEIVRNSEPQTQIKPLELTWTDTASGQSIELTWLLVIFGREGMKYEHQLQAIRDYLQIQTGKNAEDWSDNLPDLVTHATLTIIPLWNNIALRSSGSVQYVNSPVVKIQEIEQAASLRYGPGMSDEERNALIYLPTPHKNSGAVFITEAGSGPNTQFRDLYPDYCLLDVNDINRSKLKSATRTMLMLLKEALTIAEIDQPGNSIPSQFQRITVEGLTYISYSVESITHRVLTKASAP